MMNGGMVDGGWWMVEWWNGGMVEWWNVCREGIGEVHTNWCCSSRETNKNGNYNYHTTCIHCMFAQRYVTRVLVKYL